MPSERLPKKTKANGFWTFATSVRAQLQLYNPSEAASYVTHSQELWELMSKDEQQEWKVFAREMEVRERLCPEYVVDIVADVQKQYDEDQKKLKLSSFGVVKDEPELSEEEQNEVPPALTPNVVLKRDERVSTVRTDEVCHDEWHTASESTETVASNHSPVAETGLGVQEMPDSGKGVTLPAGSNISTKLKPAATVKEATGTGLDGLFGDGGLNEFMRLPTHMTPMGAAAKWSQQKKLGSVPTTNASAPAQTAPPTAFRRENEVTESFVPATAVHDDSVRSYGQQPQPSPVFVFTTDCKDLPEPELSRFELSIGVDSSPDTGNAERVSRAETTSPTTVRRSSSGSTLPKKRPTTLPPSVLMKKEAAAKAATVQKPQLEPLVVSGALMEPPSPAKAVKVTSISKSTSTLRASASRTSTKEPSTPGSPTVLSEKRSFGFGRGTSLRK